MAYYEMMPAGLPAGLQSGMDSVLNKKFGTATSYAPGTWPDDVNLMGPLPEKTIVSSPIADFSDGADDVPTKSLVVTIPPTLSGVSSVGVENEGNLCDFDDYNVEANTNTTVSLGADLTLRKGTYTLTFNISDTVTATRNRPCYVVNGNYTYADSDYKTSGRYSWTFTLSDDTTLSIRWWAHTVSANITISDFMLTYGSTAHAYEPYQTPTTYTASLGRTIYGGEVDGQEINTRLGYNAFWSDEGDTEVTYRADISLALQAVSGLRGLMMARTQLEPETEPEETIEETPEEMER